MDRQYSPEIRKRLKELAQEDLYLNRRPRADIVGKRFGRLVIQRAVGHASRGRLLILSHCDCGGARISSYDSLVNGVKSCGCLEEELKPALKRQRKFGELLKRTIESARTAKPVAAQYHPHIDTDDIDIKATHTLIEMQNRFGSDNDG